MADALDDQVEQVIAAVGVLVVGAGLRPRFQVLLALRHGQPTPDPHRGVCLELLDQQELHAERMAR